MTILIADSGSTKTDWFLTDMSANSPLSFQTKGLNPCLMSDKEILSVLTTEVLPHLSEGATTEGDIPTLKCIRFYGAGCRPDQLERMERLLCSTLHAERAIVASDLLGAAHALCGREAGIVAILGTGSGSAVYDGTTFAEQTPSLGYILGDEGSGAVLGRRLVGDVFKRQLPASILEAFEKECGVTIDEIIRRVYREPAPSRYLASFTYFLAAHRDNEAIHRLLVNEFRLFFTRNCVIYNRPDLCVHIIGSLGVVFEAEIRESAALEGFRIGKIIKSPGNDLVDFWISR